MLVYQRVVYFFMFDEACTLFAKCKTAFASLSSWCVAHVQSPFCLAWSWGEHLQYKWWGENNDSHSVSTGFNTWTPFENFFLFSWCFHLWGLQMNSSRKMGSVSHTFAMDAAWSSKSLTAKCFCHLPLSHSHPSFCRALGSHSLDTLYLGSPAQRDPPNAQWSERKRGKESRRNVWTENLLLQKELIHLFLN